MYHVTAVKVSTVEHVPSRLIPILSTDVSQCAVLHLTVHDKNYPHSAPHSAPLCARGKTRQGRLESIKDSSSNMAERHNSSDYCGDGQPRQHSRGGSCARPSRAAMDMCSDWRRSLRC
jgi:hypothetical protein